MVKFVLEVTPVHEKLHEQTQYHDLTQRQIQIKNGVILEAQLHDPVNGLVKHDIFLTLRVIFVLQNLLLVLHNIFFVKIEQNEVIKIHEILNGHGNVELENLLEVVMSVEQIYDM